MTDRPRPEHGIDGRNRPTAADDWEFGPMVPTCPPGDASATPSRQERPRFERPLRTDYAPTDRDTEAIEPLVPDFR